uniref:Uncharacterized protein n=2 Tax=Trichobilharzia regenti TaxID=157069 RepID=A0AA85J3G2_TRIRE|nr:unnamed protein product [Trichobilharzia regenti]
MASFAESFSSNLNFLDFASKMNDLQYEIIVQEVVQSELRQTVSSQPIYERFGGNIFLPASRTKLLMACEEKLKKLRDQSLKLKADKS